MNKMNIEATAFNKVLAIGIVVVSLTMLGQYANAGDTENNPFTAIWTAIEDLQDQIDEIELTPGPKGDKGDTGAQGPAGVDGMNGIDGEDGTDGLNTLIKISNEPAGSNCPNGGKKIESGIDDDRDGVLDSEEVDSISYISNGEDGDSLWTQNGNDIKYSAGNVEVNKIDYNTPRTHYLSIDNAELVGFDGMDIIRDDGGYYQTVIEKGAFYHTTSCGWMKASILLPDGARITNWTAYFYDDSANSIEFSIKARYLPTHKDYYYGNMTSTSEGSGAVTKTISSLYIDYSLYSYDIWVYSKQWNTAWSSGGIGVYGFTIEYTISEAV